MFRFQKLAVWQKAIDFADSVYRLTGTFPSDERFGLVSQMRRAAVSVSSNVAEGSGRTSNAVFSRFVEIAYGSLLKGESNNCIKHQRVQRRELRVQRLSVSFSADLHAARSAFAIVHRPAHTIRRNLRDQ